MKLSSSFCSILVLVLLTLAGLTQADWTSTLTFGLLTSKKDSTERKAFSDESSVNAIHQWTPTTTEETIKQVTSAAVVSRLNTQEAINYIQEVTVGLKVSEMCLRKATFALTGRCMDLDEQDLGKFAVLLTNCHLAQSNRPTYPCQSDDSLEYCTRTMSDVAFGVYTTILTHTQDICIRLQEEVRWEASEKVMLELLDKSYQTALQLGALNTVTKTLGKDIEEISSLNREVSHEVKLGFSNSIKSLHQIEQSSQTLYQTFAETSKKQQELAEEGLNSLDRVLSSTENIQETSLKSLNDLESLSEVALKQQQLSEAGLESLKKVLSTTDIIKETSEGIKEASKKSLDGLEHLTESHNKITKSIAELTTQTDLASVRQKELLEHQRVLAEEQLRLQELGGEISTLMSGLLTFRNVALSTFRGALWYILYLSFVYFLSGFERFSWLRFPLFMGIIFSFGVEIFYLAPSLSGKNSYLILGLYRLTIGVLSAASFVLCLIKWNNEERRRITDKENETERCLKRFGEIMVQRFEDIIMQRSGEIWRENEIRQGFSRNTEIIEIASAANSKLSFPKK